MKKINIFFMAVLLFSFSGNALSLSFSDINPLKVPGKIIGKIKNKVYKKEKLETKTIQQQVCMAKMSSDGGGQGACGKPPEKTEVREGPRTSGGGGGGGGDDRTRYQMN